MTANRYLAVSRGLDDTTIERIDYLHEYLDKLMKAWVKEPFQQGRKDEIHSVEYQLQGLWGFEHNMDYHTYAPLYEFRCQWVGCTFQCQDTGETFTIPADVREKDFFSVGNGYVDVGVLNRYCRFGGSIKEVDKCKD